MRLHHRPLFIFTVAYILGIVGATLCRLGPLTLLGIGGGIVLLGVIFVRGRYRSVVALALAVLTIGLVRTSAYRQVPSNDISGFAEGKLVYLTGRVASDPEVRGDRTSFVLQADEVKTYTEEGSTGGRVMVTLYHLRGRETLFSVPHFGEKIKIHGRLEIPSPSSNPGAFDYGAYLARQRIFCTLRGTSADVEILKPASFSIAWLASRFRSTVAGRALADMSTTHARLLLGILFGDYTTLPLAVQGSFMRTGTMHLLAASGFNCGVIALMFGWVLSKVSAPRVWRHLVLIALLWGFVLVVGAGPSIVRASIMMTVFLAAYLLKKAPDMLNIVLFACLVILAVNPLSLYDVGFQLSFAAVLAIILMMPPIDQRVSAWFKLRPSDQTNRLGKVILWTARSIVLAVAISIVATLGTWPITAYYFNYVSVISVVANSLTALLVVALTGAGIAAIALGWIAHTIGHVVALPASGLAWLMLRVVTGLGDLTWATISVRSPSWITILVYYLVLLGVLEYAARKTSPTKRVAGIS